MIAVRRLCKSYGPRSVLRDLDFDVESGQVMLLLGANGAGKSTLLRCLLGLVRFDGTVRVEGLDPLTQGREVRARIGYMPQRDGLHDDMTVLATLRFYGSLREVVEPRQEELLEAAGLGEAANHRIDEISGGMRQRLAFALALLADPPVLLLDEPTASLDGWSRDYLVDSVLGLAGRGKAIVLSTHSEHPALRGAGASYWLRDGRLDAAATGAAAGVTS